MPGAPEAAAFDRAFENGWVAGVCVRIMALLIEVFLNGADGKGSIGQHVVREDTDSSTKESAVEALNADSLATIGVDEALIMTVAMKARGLLIVIEWTLGRRAGATGLANLHPPIIGKFAPMPISTALALPQSNELSHRSRSHGAISYGTLWGYLKDSKERFAEYEKLLDYYHASEHLSQAAEALFGKKSDEGTRWYLRWCAKLKIEEWAVDGLIRSLRYHQQNRKLRAASAKGYKHQLGFFVRNRQWINYASFVNRNLPIGSRPTEAACKTIVKERMCRSGMRWTRSVRASPLLTLRAIHKSKQWDQTWNEYRRQLWNKAS